MAVSTFTLPNGAKQYISGSPVTQDVLRIILEPETRYRLSDIEKALYQPTRGKVLSSLMRLQGYGLVSSDTKSKDNKIEWTVNKNYSATIRALIYGEK